MRKGLVSGRHSLRLLAIVGVGLLAGCLPAMPDGNGTASYTWNDQAVLNIGSQSLVGQVTTITGTAGWEALKFQKPVITFGLAWYNCLNYVSRWNDKININKIANTKFNINNLKKSLIELTKKMPDGMDNVEYQDQSDFTSNFELERFNYDKEIDTIGKSIKSLVAQHK